MPSIEADAISPFVLEPHLVERIWGAESLDPWFPELPPGRLIGEVWLTAEECSVIDKPGTLADMARQYPGELGNAGRNGFPLLIKLLYPREKLSVQVHPNDEQAQASLQQPRGKTECWYVLSAEPGAQVAVGFREPLPIAEIQRNLIEGTIEDKLRMLPVKAGDMVFVDAGTVHAIGPGMVVLETQQYSDVTYRLWDYGRPRELHLEAGMAVARAQTKAGLVEPVSMDSFDRLVACPYFTVDRMRMKAASSQPLGDTGRLQVLISLGSGCSVACGDQATLELPPGHALILPAGQAACTLHAETAVEIIRVLGPSEVA